jgi:hypothetical protein
VIELRGYHFFNQDLVRGRATYVRTVVLGNIENSQVELPVSPGKTEKFSMKELGIGYAILASDLALETKFRIPNPDYQGPRRTPSGQEAAGAPAIGTAAKGAPATGAPAKGAPATGAPAKGAPAGAAGDSKQPPAAAPEADNPPYFVAPKYTFIVQFCWQERLLSDRLKARLQATQQQGTGPESGGPKDQSKPKQGDIAGM